jgi:hypothetical protein
MTLSYKSVTPKQDVIKRFYGPQPLLIPDKQVLKRCLKSLNLRARNEFDPEKKYKCQVIRDEIKQLFNELYK